MRLEVTGRHVAITSTLRQLVERKLGKLDQLLNHGAVSAQVVLSEVPRARRVDMTLHARGEHFLHGAAEATTWDAAVSRAVGRLSQQAKKVKGRWQERKRAPRVSAPPVVELQPRLSRPARGGVRMPPILRATQSTVKTMSLTEAVRAVESSADNLVIFRQAGTVGVSVLYRRPGGELTLLETES